MRSFGRSIRRIQSVRQLLQIFAFESEELRHPSSLFLIFLLLRVNGRRHPIPRDEGLEMRNFVGGEDSDPVAFVDLETGRKSQATNAICGFRPFAANRLDDHSLQR